MRNAQYTVLARNRPIQVAFLINVEAFTSRAEALNDLVDAIVDWNHTHWGGRTNPITFFNGNTLAEEDWLHLEVADSDCVSVVGPVTQELINALDDRLHPWGVEVNDKPSARGFTVPYEAQGIAVPPTPANLRRLQGLLNPLSGGQEKLLMFEFAEGCDPDIRRFVHRNFGTYHQWVLPGTKQVRRIAWLEKLLPGVSTHRVPISDVTSLATALTELSGRMRRGDMRPALPFIAPYQLASLDLEVWPATDFGHVYQIIIGDTPADFAEFWNGMLPRQNWWCTHEAQLWIPTSLIRDGTFHDALLDWLRRYTGSGNNERRIELASASLPVEELERIRQTLYRADPPVPTEAPNPRANAV